MIDVAAVNAKKEAILNFIRTRGPSLPVQVANSLNIPSLFASAFLSELKAEQKLKISNLRVGSSPLYFIDGQEAQLEKFVEYFNSREKEAFNLLKSENFLDDEAQTPVVRVALRAIKDFAIPVRVRVGEEMKTFWKYFSLSDEEFMKFFGEKIGRKEVSAPAKLEEEKIREIVIPETRAAEKKSIKKIKVKKVLESEFSKKVKEHLFANDIEILEILCERKKEFSARVRTDEKFGKQEFLLVAKDKKSVTENDLAMALHQAQGGKRLGIFMATGELNKKAGEYLAGWGNLVKWERLE